MEGGGISKVMAGGDFFWQLQDDYFFNLYIYAIFFY